MIREARREDLAELLELYLFYVKTVFWSMIST